MRRVRVALVVSNFHRLHGVAVYYRSLVPLLGRDLEVAVLSTDVEAPECDFPIRSRGRRAPARTPEVDWLVPHPHDIEDALLSLRPDVVHVTDNSALGLMALNTARRLGFASALTHHTDLTGFMRTSHRNPWFARSAHAVARAAYRRATSVSALGPLGVQAAARTFGVSPSEIQLLHPGVDLELFSPPTDPRRRAGPCQVLTVSRLSAEKRIDLLIDACLGLRDRADVRLVVVGRGPRRQDLEARAGDTVEFKGALEAPELASLYRRSDLFALASPAEIFPQVLLEAQASGLPCIVSPSGGARQAITSASGVVAGRDDAASFARAIEGLTSDPIRLDAMGNGARVRATAYTWNRAAADLIGWYGGIHMRATSRAGFVHQGPPTAFAAADRTA